jgi:hypothetical protein
MFAREHAQPRPGIGELPHTGMLQQGEREELRGAQKSYLLFPTTFASYYPGMSRLSPTSATCAGTAPNLVFNGFSIPLDLSMSREVDDCVSDQGHGSRQNAERHGLSLTPECDGAYHVDSLGNDDHQ